MAAKILIAVISLIGTAAFAKDVTLGDPSEGRLVYEEIFEKEPSPNNTATGIKHISVPNETIKAIVIEDLQGDGRVTVLDGGVGKSDVKLALYGDRDKGFKFRVKIYVERKPKESTETPEETTTSTQETDGTTETEETTEPGETDETEETEGTEKPEKTTPMNSRTTTRKPGKNKKQKKPHPKTREPKQQNQETPDDEPNDDEPNDDEPKDDEPNDDEPNDYYNRPCVCACVSWFPCWSYNNCC